MLLDLPYRAKRALAIALDSSLGIGSVPLALYLRLGEFPIVDKGYLLASAIAASLAPTILALFGTYRIVFRYAGWSALTATGRAMMVYTIPVFVLFTLVGVRGVPRTIGIIQPILLFLCVGGIRGTVSLWLGRGYAARPAFEAQRILIYGAGTAGQQLCVALLQCRQHQILGFLDDSPALIGRTIFGKRVYDPANFESLQALFQVTDILLALPSVSRRRRSEIIEKVRRGPTRVRMLPGITELAMGKVSTSDLRELEIDDLLGREIVPPDAILMSRNVFDKVLLVTGAGGSIGSELCRQLIAVKPRKLILVDSHEFALYSVHGELGDLAERLNLRSLDIVPILASVCDRERMDEILRHWRPATIYHAAAYKHVPLIESNPLEGLRNNVIGTFITAQLAEKHEVETFILISTDKAVRPTNIMGATKRLAENVLQAMAESSKTRFAMVRFGNVLGSSGSVVPLFKQQIRRGGPITVTHPDVIRYFMTIPEAAQLVIQAGALASGGDVFVLDMGQPVKIIDLANKMVELSGLTVRSSSNPNGDIEISYTGLRSGEKLYEELLIGENSSFTVHPRIMCAREEHISWKKLEPMLFKLESRLRDYDTNEAMALLYELVPEYVTPVSRVARQAS